MRANSPLESWYESLTTHAVVHHTQADILLTVAQGRDLLVIDGRTGEQAGRVTVDALIHVATDDGTVLVVDGERGLLRYDRGRYANPSVFLPDRPALEEVVRAPLYDTRRGLAYIITEADGVYVFELAPRGEQGGREIKHYPNHLFAGTLQATLDDAGPSSVLVAASSAGLIYRLDPLGGDEVRTYSTGGSPRYPPVVYEGMAIVLLDGWLVSATDLSVEAGSPVWQHPLPAGPSANMTLASVAGAAYGYVPCGDILHAFSFTSETVEDAWERRLDDPINGPAAIHRGQVVVGTTEVYREQVVVATTDVHGIDAAKGGPDLWSYNGLMQHENKNADETMRQELNSEISPGVRLQIARCFPGIEGSLRPSSNRRITVSDGVIFAPLTESKMLAFTPFHSQGDVGAIDLAGCAGLTPIRSLYWRFEPQETFNAAPAVIGKRVWVGSSNGGLSAAPIRRGLDLPLEETLGEEGIVALLAGVDGVVYAATSKAALYTRAAGVWTRSIALFDTVVARPALEDGILAIASSGKARLYIVDTARGRQVGTAIDVGSPVRSAGSLSRGSLVFGDDLGRIHVFGVTSSGARAIGYIDTGAAVRGGGSTAVNGVVYVGNEDGFVYAVTADAMAAWRQVPERAPIRRTPAADGRYVYVPYTTGLIVALDYAGDEVWRFRREGAPVEALSPLLLGDEILLVPFADGRIAALDRYDGQRQWDHQIPGRLSADGLLADGRLYVVTVDGDLHTLDPAGALTW
ncbi:PQQ-binding-like beta-propeller repeat protein [Candidatus Poribacteria bacterium]|nr:PQQ-binding-like beta-propeller repeat protein [Candidatus Poribacteria bacterium]